MYLFDSICRGEYGLWTAFLALLVRLFFFIPAQRNRQTARLQLGSPQGYKAYMFISGDKSHPLTDQIHHKLKVTTLKVERNGLPA
ncbi:unnamed protein product [Rhodiola kirilowii]